MSLCVPAVPELSGAPIMNPPCFFLHPCPRRDFLCFSFVIASSRPFSGHGGRSFPDRPQSASFALTCPTPYELLNAFFFALPHTPLLVAARNVQPCRRPPFTPVHCCCTALENPMSSLLHARSHPAHVSVFYPFSSLVRCCFDLSYFIALCPSTMVVLFF